MKGCKNRTLKIKVIYEEKTKIAIRVGDCYEMIDQFTYELRGTCTEEESNS